MRIKFGKKPVLLAAAALTLTATLTVGSAMAYFTAHSEASGAVRMNIGFTETEVDETVDGDGKHVTIKNIGDYDCFVRVKVFSVIDVDYSPFSGWEDGGDGYWYYTPVLPAGGSTEELLVTFEYPVNTEEDKKEEFNIIVVQECTPVVYDEAGSPAADWDRVITSDGTD